jgi:UDP-3-O-[3-hydroxymyristoyl] N-acetylglucosamine deacetylase
MIQILSYLAKKGGKKGDGSIFSTWKKIEPSPFFPPFFSFFSGFVWVILSLKLQMAKKITIQKELDFFGFGIHSGRPVDLRLLPSESGEIVFKRTDLDNLELRLSAENIKTKNCTMLETDRGKILTLEHLLAVLWVYGVDSLTIELNQEEIPSMDGSALHFARAIQRAGFRELSEEKEPQKITKSHVIHEEDASIAIDPDPELRITYQIEFEHPCIQKQDLSVVVSPEKFEKEIAPARTFGFLEDVPALQKQGLALGGSYQNTIVLDKTHVVNGPLRYPDEFVRHKILDLIGDLSLLGNPVTGHFLAKKAGHDLHLRIVRFLLDNQEYLSPDQ